MAIGVAAGVDISSVVITPNTGDPVTADVVIDGHNASSPCVSLYQAVIADGATAATVTVNYASAPFASAMVMLWQATAADFDSTTASSTGGLRSLAATDVSVDLSVVASGAVIMLGAQLFVDVTQDFNTSASDLTFTEDFSSSVSGINVVGFHVNEIAAADATSATAVTSTFAGNMRVVSAHWR
jgi:hypothetical protein